MSVWAVASPGGLCLPGEPVGSPALLRLRGAPPYPGASVVEPATVPDPPLLDSSRDERSRVLTLCFTWRNVLRARMGKHWFVHPKIVTPRWTYFRQFASAAEELIAHAVWPAAWAAWTIDVWRRDGTTEAPPVTLVWAAKRIAKRAGWFGKECSGYLGGRAIFGTKHRELLRRWTAMGYELMRAGDDTAESARIVERWFPGKLYDELVRAAQIEAVTKTAELRSRLEDGEWLWS